MTPQADTEWTRGLGFTVTGRIDVYTLSEKECVAVASNGQQWRLAAPLSVLQSERGEEVLNELRAQVGPHVAPTRDPIELVLASASAVNGIASEIESSGTLERAVLFPFAGYWHRLLLTPDTGVALARTAIECLLATISDTATAAVLLRPADLQDALWDWSPPGPESATPGALQRWVGGVWISHPLTPAPLIDPVTGILHRVVQRPSEHPLPTGFVHLHAELPHLESIDPLFRPDALAPAGALDVGNSPALDILEPGVLSGVAHYCGADLGQGTRQQTSAADLDRRGERWFDLQDWEPHNPELHAIPGFPFAAFDRHHAGEWVLGSDTEGEVWVPLSLVHAGYLRDDDDPGTATNANNLVGLHVGRSWEEALERACAHVVAHDAVAVWWSSTRQAEEAPLPTVVKQVMTSSPLDTRILAIPSTFLVPVRLAVIDDTVGDIVSLGFAAHCSPDRASELAVVEALIQHASARDLTHENSLIRNSAALGNGAIAGLAEFDSTRRYAQVFGQDHRGLIDPMAHVQYGLDPDVIRRTRARLTPSGAAPAEGSTPSITRTLDGMTRVITIDVSTERVRSAGLHAVRVLIPGLARLQPAAFPLDPTGRLARAHAVLGWNADQDPQPYPGW